MSIEIDELLQEYLEYCNKNGIEFDVYSCQKYAIEHGSDELKESLLVETGTRQAPFSNKYK